MRKINPSLKPLAPREGERPTVYADRLGQWYAQWATTDHKKRLGQYLTPVEVADFMAGCLRPTGGALQVLDPGAGMGVLSCALCEALTGGKRPPTAIHLSAYEIDDRLADYLESCLSYAAKWLKERGTLFSFKVERSDFILAHASSLDERPGLFPPENHAAGQFDLAIANPPYFKIPKSDARAQVAAAVVHGQPNIYALFMAVMASLLKLGGQLVFITPRSYAAGPYFRLFREQFFSRMRPRTMHLFDSRREAFGRDEILQESLILHAQRDDGWPDRPSHKDEAVRVSFSHGVQDLASVRKRRVPLVEVLHYRSKEKLLRVPTVDTDTRITSLVGSWSNNLRAFGLNISTGPVVPFRAVELLAKEGYVPRTHAPLLWMQNVTAMRVQWPSSARGKAQYMLVNERARTLLLPNKNYVLMRRFSAKEATRRLVAAPFLTGQIESPFLGLENHLNYLHRPGGTLTDEEAYGFAALFNSVLLDAYFRTFNGNTQVSATELREMPLPPLHLVVEIGRQALASDLTAQLIDSVIADVLEIKNPDLTVSGMARV